MNVVDYVYGPEPLVLFLFDPFGRETFRSVVANLEASLRESPAKPLLSTYTRNSRMCCRGPVSFER